MRGALMDGSIAFGSSFPSGSNSILHVKDKRRTSDWAATPTSMQQCVANIQTAITEWFPIHLLNCVFYLMNLRFIHVNIELFTLWSEIRIQEHTVVFNTPTMNTSLTQTQKINISITRCRATVLHGNWYTIKKKKKKTLKTSQMMKIGTKCPPPPCVWTRGYSRT